MFLLCQTERTTHIFKHKHTKKTNSFQTRHTKLFKNTEHFFRNCSNTHCTNIILISKNQSPFYKQKTHTQNKSTYKSQNGLMWAENHHVLCFALPANQAYIGRIRTILCQNETMACGYILAKFRPPGNFKRTENGKV